MKKTTASFLVAGMTLSVLSAGVANAQSLIFYDGFENDPVGASPLTTAEGGEWAAVSAGTGGAPTIVQDSGDQFSYGSSNNMLRIDNGIGFSLQTPDFSSEIVTLSFDFIDNRTTVSSGGAERLSVQFFASIGEDLENADRAHIFSVQNGSEIRSGQGTYTSEQPIRFDIVVNNSADSINYEGPNGSVSLAGDGDTHVWMREGANWSLAAGPYSFARGADGAGPIERINFQTFSTDRFSVDIDNFAVWDDAVVGAIPEPSTYALIFGLLVLGGAACVRRRRR